MSPGAPIVFSGTSVNPPMEQGETLTLTTTGNSVNSAVVEIFVFYEG